MRGGVGTNPAGQPLATAYVTIDDDPRAYLDRVVAMGGAIVMPPTKGPGDITFALFSDPQGNVVGSRRAPEPLRGRSAAPPPGIWGGPTGVGRPRCGLTRAPRPRSSRAGTGPG